MIDIGSFVRDLARGGGQDVRKVGVECILRMDGRKRREANLAYLSMIVK